jgi:pimeloyl-ACP methyl ester carboxylesterase
VRILTLPYAGPAGSGAVEYALAGGSPPPATLFLHGLAGSIEDTRPLASGVPGRKIFAHLPGPGGSTGPEPLGYDTLAAAALAVADHERATAAFGVSLGAATLLRILSRTPDRFERVVLYLPAVADIPRKPEAVEPHRDLADRLAAADAEGVADALLRTQPLKVRDTRVAREWAERRAQQLIAEDGGPGRWLPLASAVPLEKPDEPDEPDEPAAQNEQHDAPHEQPLARLRDVRIPILVIAQEGDPAHPVETARRVASALPTARLEVFDEDGALWGHRAELRTLVAGFLGAADGFQH